MVAYDVAIKNYKAKYFYDTLRIYREAVSYLADIALLEYEFLSSYRYPDKRQGAFENLIHSTKSNPAKYSSFDRLFYKFPSYFRRSALNDAYGIADSYMKALRIWKDEGCLGKKPKFIKNRNVFPCLYRKSSFIEDNGNFFIKVLYKNDWVWKQVYLRKTDLDYMDKIIRNGEADKFCAPVLVYNNKRFRLRFACDRKKPEAKKFVKDVNSYVKVSINNIKD